MSTTQVATPIRERFDELKDDWKSKTRHLSNTAQISLVFSYQQIIGMGPARCPADFGGIGEGTGSMVLGVGGDYGRMPNPPMRRR